MARLSSSRSFALVAAFDRRATVSESTAGRNRDTLQADRDLLARVGGGDEHQLLLALGEARPEFVGQGAADRAVEQHAVTYRAPEPGPAGKRRIDVDRVVVAAQRRKAVEVPLVEDPIEGGDCARLDLHPLSLPIQSPQLPFDHLAGGVAGERLQEDDRPRHLVAAQVGAAVLDDLGLGQRLPALTATSARPTSPHF